VVELALALLVLTVPVWRWISGTQRHRKRVDALQVRVHVNGIRGKSSVSRMIAGILRQAGYTTVAKTTGSAAVVIDRQGGDHPIIRSGPATILEQIDIIEQWAVDGVNALVIECMAINPNYQRVCERQIVRSDIGVITNVREDHQDVMGVTLPEITKSLLNTCPREGVLITAEQNAELTAIMATTAEAMGSRLVVADPDLAATEDMVGFGHIEFEDNVVIGLEVARHLGIPRDVAMRGMWSAQPDPGVLRVVETEVDGVRVTWANMFAVNDRESTIAVLDRVKRFAGPETVLVGILNNRPDRQQRALQFADIASRDLDCDILVTFGVFEKVVTERLLANGYPRSQILNLGDERGATWDQIVQEMILDRGSPHVLLAGMVNIHTHQAEELLEFFEQAETLEKTLHTPEHR
jgi:poly-gamma-glutamate synthase PgsB/CapB